MTYARTRSKNRLIREGNPAFTVLMYIAAAVVLLITVYPMYYVMIMSISDPKDVLAKTVYFLPTGFFTDSYRYVLADPQLWRSLGNSAVYVAVTTVFHLVVCVLFAYPLAMPKLIGRSFFVWFLLIPMYFSGGLIPTFLVYTKLGLYNSIWALILPASYSMMHIILLRTYFRHSVPLSLRESAMIDGANNYQTLLRIYLPLSTPVLAVVSIYCIVQVWNSWFPAMVYITDQAFHPIQLYLKKVLVENNATSITAALTPEEAEELYKATLVKIQLQYTVIVITTLPILCVYPFLQKYFVKGIMIGSLKG
ncbi:MAG: carbohydrate ABC transporter permease [Christensenellales bacterium]